MGVVLVGLQPGFAKDPLAMSLTSTAQVDLGVQPVDIHSKICKISPPPYQYQATILYFSDSALFQTILRCPSCAKEIAWDLSLLGSTTRVPLAVRSHTVPPQLAHKPCISQIDRF